jgi:glutamine---fructose-6-phosphate transaminase (isomerizing)
VSMRAEKQQRKMSRRPGRYPHFMLKEIHEQPRAVRRVIEELADTSGKIMLKDLPFSAAEIRGLEKITLAASGSSRHAGMIGEFMLERMAGLPVEVDFASQYCYRDPVVGPHELTIFISQSGTTIDTITALRVARRKGSKSLAICNVPDTPLTREADCTLLTHAGKEVAIAATKSFTTQLAVLFLLSMHIAQMRGRSDPAMQMALAELRRLPEHMKRTLNTGVACKRFARKLYRCKDFIYMGRDIGYPVALEGALKLKEVSYIHAEGYPTGELKHGPTALVNEQLPIVVLATRDARNPDSVLRYEKTVSNVKEFVQRGIPVLAIITEGDKELARIAPGTIAVPDVPVLLQPFVEVMPLQFLAYHIAVLCGRDVDRPRHLSKSVVAE